MAEVSKSTATSGLKTIQSTGVSTNTKYMKNSIKNFKEFSYFLGGIDVTHQNLDQFTPYIRGVSRIFLHKPPLFMAKLSQDKTDNFKTFIEAGYSSVSGIADVSVDFTDFTGGFAGQTFNVVQSARDETNNVTISVYELTGSPIREYIDTWVTGVRDPRSGIAHYHGLIEKYFKDSTQGIPYGEINHTAEFIYTTYDPTGLYLEYSCMFAHCFPTRVPKDHLNYESGSRDNAPMDLEFNCTKYESPAINDIGIWYSQNSKVNWNYLEFTPEFVSDNGTQKGYMSSAAGNVYTYDYGLGRGTEHQFELPSDESETITDAVQLDQSAVTG